MALDRVKFNNVAIGDYAWAEISYQGNVVTRIIPRALGVRIYSTSEMGGGQRRITVHAYVIKATRKDLEEYFRTLPASLGYAAATLTVDGVSYTNCYMESITPPSGVERWATFTVNFIQSV